MLDLVSQGRVDPLAVPVTTVPVDDAAEAWLLPSTKLVITLD